MKRARGWLAAALAVLVGIGIGGAWLAHQAAREQPELPLTPADEDPDPRQTYAGPYRNIDPKVPYVGDAACAGCHAEIAKSYARHPMGRSLVPIADLAARQRYTPDTNNPFTALGRHFQVDRQGPELWHRQATLDEAGKPVVELAHEVRWAIGSGAKGYSYLTERDGYLLQTPISWYTQKQRWDLSPTFLPSALSGRVVSASCLFCHANRLRQNPEHPDRFLPPVFEGHAIGCERCHGPGERHIHGEGDHSIVNPARLEPRLRDAVCEQCHLEGEARLLRSGRELYDFRPGLPLSDFWAMLVEGRQGGEKARAVSHVEQMYESRCFARPVSGRKLGCISCHDPHVAVGPEERVAHYRSACLQCHDEARGLQGCSVAAAERRRISPADSCIDCHMPRYRASDIAHTASTDHRILRRPQQNQPGSRTEREPASFVNFYQDRFPKGDPQAERTLGMGLATLLNVGMLRPEREGERALLLLESALARRPNDVELRASKAQLLTLLNRPSEALAEARLVLERRPGDWRMQALAAGAAKAAGQNDLALDCWRHAVEANPCVPEYQVGLLGMLLRTGQLDEARARCDTLLQLDPFNPSGRQARIGFLLQQGKKEEAIQEFEVLRRLRPPDLAEREKWFREQMR